MNNNNNNAPGYSGRKRRRNRAGNAPAAAAQPAQKRRRTSRQNRKRAARRGRRGAAAGAGTQEFAASAYATSQRTGQAQIYRNGVDSCRIIHRELIASVLASEDFHVFQAFALNPGIAATFPWLSNEAAGWEKYRFNYIRFCYYTRCGSQEPGSLMLAPDYDASDPAPVSEVAASAYEDTQEDAPWKDICTELAARELMGDMKERYVRTGALAPNQDIKTYDCGNLFCCTADGTNNTDGWGKLWVEYDVTLITPHVPVGGFQATGVFVSGGGTVAAGTPFGAAPVSSGPIIMTTGGPPVASRKTVTLQNIQPGQEIMVTATVAGTVITAVALDNLSALTLKNTLFAGFTAAATTGAAVSTYVVNNLADGGTGFWQFDLDLTAATVTSSEVTVVVLAPQPSI